MPRFADRALLGWVAAVVVVGCTPAASPLPTAGGVSMIGVNQSSGAMVVRYLVGNDVLPGYEVPAGSNRTLPPPTSGVVRSALIFNNDCELVTVAVFTTGPASFAGGGQLFI